MLSLCRFFHILYVAFKFRLDELVLSGIRHPYAYRLLYIVRLGRAPKMTRGERLRLALESLGPVFVKFGQVLSTRRDLIPIDIAEQLALLQDQVPPFDSTLSAQMVEAALGTSPHVLFKHFETDPIASASIAQVHFAVLHDGREAAVKVLRPGMREIIDKDLALMRVMANLVEKLISDGRRLRPREVVGEFEKYLHDELDLIREASNCSQLRRNFSQNSGRGELLMVPEVYWDYCANNVFTMERMRGIPINQIQRLTDAGIDLKDIARKGVEIFFTQVFSDGFFMRICTRAIFVSQMIPKPLAATSPWISV